MSSNKKKILFISGRFPYPLHKGDQLMLYNNIRLMSQKYSITLISFYDQKSELDNLSKVKRYCEKVVLIKRVALLSYINILLSVFRLEPMQVSYYRSNLFDKKLKALLDVDEFDIIHVYMLRMAHYVKDLNIPKVISLIDSMQLNISRRVLNQTGLKKIIFTYEKWLLKGYENNYSRMFCKSIVVSKIDKESINNNNIEVIPIGVEPQVLKCDHEQSKTIIFTGNMGYFPNQNAALWFINNCLNAIKKKIPDVRFLVVGKNPPQSLRRLDDGRSIIIKGYVENIQDEMRKATISVAPMQSGSGMQIKILEAMAVGLPVVATSLGVGDINIKSGDGVQVADSAEDFSSECISLLNNKNLRINAGNLAFNYVKKNHSWEFIKKQYMHLYENLGHMQKR